MYFYLQGLIHNLLNLIFFKKQILGLLWGQRCVCFPVTNFYLNLKTPKSHSGQGFSFPKKINIALALKIWGLMQWVLTPKIQIILTNFGAFRFKDSVKNVQKCLISSGFCLQTHFKILLFREKIQSFFFALGTLNEKILKSYESSQAKHAIFYCIW